MDEAGAGTVGHLPEKPPKGDACLDYVSEVIKRI
jgi:hypothetical protein